MIQADSILIQAMRDVVEGNGRVFDAQAIADDINRPVPNTGKGPLSESERKIEFDLWGIRTRDYLADYIRSRPQFINALKHGT